MPSTMPLFAAADWHEAEPDTVVGAALVVVDAESFFEHAAASIAGAGMPLMANIIAATGRGAAARVDADLLSWRADADPSARGYAVVSGDAAELAEQLRDLARRGVTNLAIEATRDEPDVDGLIAFLGREVRPLLAG